MKKGFGIAEDDEQRFIKLSALHFLVHSSCDATSLRLVSSLSSVPRGDGTMPIGNAGALALAAASISRATALICGFGLGKRLPVHQRARGVSGRQPRRVPYRWAAT